MLFYLHYTHFHLKKSGSNLSKYYQILQATVANYSFYIFMFSSTDLVMSDNMFNLILTILLLYFVAKL